MNHILDKIAQLGAASESDTPRYSHSVLNLYSSKRYNSRKAGLIVWWQKERHAGSGQPFVYLLVHFGNNEVIGWLEVHLVSAGTPFPELPRAY